MEVMTELAKALGPPNSKIREAHYRRIRQKSWASPEQKKQIMSEVSSPLSTILRQNIAKGTTDPRVEFISQVQKQILIKFHLQNLDQASTSKSQPNTSLSIKL